MLTSNIGLDPTTFFLVQKGEGITTEYLKGYSGDHMSGVGYCKEVS